MPRSAELLSTGTHIVGFTRIARCYNGFVSTMTYGWQLVLMSFPHFRSGAGAGFFGTSSKRVGRGLVGCGAPVAVGLATGAVGRSAGGAVGDGAAAVVVADGLASASAEALATAGAAGGALSADGGKPGEGWVVGTATGSAEAAGDAGEDTSE